MSTGDFRAALGGFSAPAQSWFNREFSSPTAAQAGAWRAIATGQSVLVIAPTGSGKTLAAFFAALDRLASDNGEREGTSVLYVSPLKALAVDVERNLRAPLAGLRQESLRMGLPAPDITVAVRTGDTSPDERRRQLRHPADILITTPESLYLMLTSAARETLRGVHTVIIDEVHAVAGNKRGAHLALSLERLDALLTQPAQRIGLSATVKPPAEVARFLAGSHPVQIVAEPSDKQLEIDVVVPVADMSDLGQAAAEVTGSAAGEAPRTSIWPYVEQRITEVVDDHRSTLVFVNSRRLAERLTSQLNDSATAAHDGEPTVIARAHHGSVSKEQRAAIEDDLKAGRLPAVVATSSLELGIDMGAVDRVVQVESPPTVAAGLQRIGRAGHQVGAVSRGTVFPKHRGDLVPAAVVASAMRSGDIEDIAIPENPLDVLAQQVVAAVSMDDWDADALSALVRRAAPYQNLGEGVWTEVLDMLAGKYPSEAFAGLKPRLVWDRNSNRLTARPGAQRLAVTSGGTIPDRGLFAVHLIGERGGKIGELDEEMVYESRVGDVFALGASSWRIEDITHDRVLVSAAPGQPGKVPFWHGDSLGRGVHLGRRIGSFVRQAADGLLTSEGTLALRNELAEMGLDEWATDNLVRYLTEQRAATGRLPDDRTLVLERSRDELGDWQVVLHSPYGAAVHAPWALMAAARLQQTLGMDVQVMHADDGIVMRVPDTDDEAVFDEIREAFLVDPDDVTAGLTAAIGGSALFASRFRECAARALLLPRRDPKRRAPLWQQRQRGAQLLAVASEHARFPIVLEAVRECLQDVYDVPALTGLLTDIRDGRVQLHQVDTETASPFATSLLFGYIAAFMYEGDTPLAERRAQALTLDTALLAELLGTEELRSLLDAEAIEQVEAEVGWLTEQRRLRDHEDLADALRTLGPLTGEDIRARGGMMEWAEQLVAEQRALRLPLRGGSWAAIEDAGRLRDALGISLPLGVPATFTEVVADPLGELLTRYARTHGPFRTADAALHFGIGAAVAQTALAALAARGALISGEFRPGGSGSEWVDPDVLRRIRRRSIAALRAQAEPVGQDDYARFLVDWHVGRPKSGVDGVYAALDMLAGVPMPASALETLILPARVGDYRPEMLDELTAAGEVLWCANGQLPGGDGWLVLTPADASYLLPRAAAPDSELAVAVMSVLGDGGGWFYGALLERLSAEVAGNFDPTMVPEVLSDLLWSGHITNDTIGPVRLGGNSRGRRRSPRPPAVRQRSRRRMPIAPIAALGRGRAAFPPQLAGRWSAVQSLDVDGTTRAAAVAPWLLGRHPVLVRGSMAIERFPGGFAAAYRVLSAMEEAGNCVRAYAVEGLGGAQFTTIATVDALREAAEKGPRGEAHVLAAADPAQPYGAALPWPAVAGRALGSEAAVAPAHRPGRKAGAVVVLTDGHLALYLERGGRSILTFDVGDEQRTTAIAALSEAVRSGRLPAVNLQRCNGDEIVGSPLAAELMAAGFTHTPRGLRLRAG